MRINFFGGPGSGKSTTAARTFAALKESGKSVELVGEYVKSWAYQDRTINKLDQLYLFGKQHQYEYRFLSNGVKNVVSDSPCFLSYVYQRKYMDNQKIADAILTICKEYDSDYPCKNIFLRRGAKPYVSEGRYQTQTDAKELDSYIFSLLQEHYQDNLTVIDFYDKKSIEDFCLKSCD